MKIVTKSNQNLDILIENTVKNKNNLLHIISFHIIDKTLCPDFSLTLHLQNDIPIARNIVYGSPLSYNLFFFGKYKSTFILNI